MPFATKDQLYATLCQVITQTTGRKAWGKGGIQSVPNYPYATVSLESGDSFAKDTVQVSELIVDGIVTGKQIGRAHV